MTNQIYDQLTNHFSVSHFTKFEVCLHFVQNCQLTKCDVAKVNQRERAYTLSKKSLKLSSVTSASILAFGVNILAFFVNILAIYMSDPFLITLRCPPIFYQFFLWNSPFSEISVLRFTKTKLRSSVRKRGRALLYWAGFEFEPILYWKIRKISGLIDLTSFKRYLTKFY